MDINSAIRSTTLDAIWTVTRIATSNATRDATRDATREATWAALEDLVQ